MSDEWWYALKGTGYGPLDGTRLGRLLTTGVLDAQSWVWTPGMLAWARAGSVEAFREPLRIAGPSGLAPAPYPPLALPDPGRARWAGPWSRLLAQSVDQAFFIAIVILIIATAGHRVDGNGSKFLLTTCLIPIGLLAQAVLIAATGATPGKTLLNLRLRHPDGSIPALSTLIERQIRLWLTGQALGLPLIGVIAMYLGKQRLDRAQRTAWDAATDIDVYQVVHRTGRFVLAFLILATTQITTDLIHLGIPAIRLP